MNGLLQPIIIIAVVGIYFGGQAYLAARSRAQARQKTLLVRRFR